MKLPSFICFLFLCIGIVLGLIELWFQLWSHEIFFKVIITDGALFVLSFVFVFLVRENKASEKITKGNSLD